MKKLLTTLIATTTLFLGGCGVSISDKPGTVLSTITASSPDYKNGKMLVIDYKLSRDTDVIFWDDGDDGSAEVVKVKSIPQPGFTVFDSSSSDFPRYESLYKRIWEERR